MNSIPHCRSRPSKWCSRRRRTSVAGRVAESRLFDVAGGGCGIVSERTIRRCGRRLRQRSSRSPSENVRDYYEHVFRPDLTTIVVIGNVTPEPGHGGRRTNISESGRLPGLRRRPIFRQCPRIRPCVTAVPDKSRVQVNVSLGETLGLNRFDPDYYALRTGEPRAGRRFLRHAPVSGFARELRARLFRVVLVRRGQDAGGLPSGLRLRSAECFQSARRGRSGI